MNQRARNRLLGVTAIIVIIIAAIFAGSMQGSDGPAYYKTVQETAEKSAELAGTKVTVGGPVVKGSWDKKTQPMRFTISDEKKPDAQLKVVFNGTVPTTFGDDVIAIVTGKLSKDGTVEATELQTKCPEKQLEKGDTAITVDTILGSADKLKGLPVKIKGTVVAGSFVAPGGDVRFVLQGEDASATVKVKYDGAVPEGFKDGVAVVVGGSIDENKVFDATSVNLQDLKASK